MSQQGGLAPEQPASVDAPTLRIAQFDDYPQICRLESRNSLRVMAEPAWRSLFLDNPLWSRVGETWPIGWVLEDDDATVVGSILNIPSLYRWRGKELICANGRGWAVDTKYRGYALWLMYEYYNQGGVDLFINTTVADWVTSVQFEFAIKVPLGDWTETAFRPTRYRAFAADGLAMRGIPLARVLAPIAGGAMWLRDALFARIPTSPESIDVGELAGFDERFDDLSSEILSAHPDVLRAERDSQTLNWHYAIPAAKDDLRIFTASRSGALRAYCVLLRHPGYEGFHSMRLVDFQTAEPDIDLLSPLLRAAVRWCAAEKVHALWHVGSQVPKMRSFDRVALYRIERNWRFFYQVSDAELAAELGKSEVWDPSEFDGDASFE